MANDINFSEINELELLTKLSATVQRHIANLENSLAMMRNGHFIDAYQRINGTKEGLLHIKYVVEGRSAYLNNNNEKNIQ